MQQLTMAACFQLQNRRSRPVFLRLCSKQYLAVAESWSMTSVIRSLKWSLGALLVSIQPKLSDNTSGFLLPHEHLFTHSHSSVPRLALLKFPHNLNSSLGRQRIQNWLLNIIPWPDPHSIIDILFALPIRCLATLTVLTNRLD